jgi:hypothetical protein
MIFKSHGNDLLKKLNIIRNDLKWRADLIILIHSFRHEYEIKYI